ncbi:MAG: hypothetical protein DMG26_06050 [Acidobacteria bacterium]|nr:MAG: hypothetical protein DMG26_06050 [Acidobacteriota bacterium]
MRLKKARAVRAVEILCASAGVAAAYAHAAAQVPVPLQPFAQQVRQIETALKYLGQPLSPAEQSQINAAIANPDEAAAVAGIERILDHYTLAVVDINPESRVKVAPGPAKAELVEAGTRIFLVKVRNQAGVTSRLMVESPNSGPVYIRSDSSPQPPVKLTAAEAEERWADISLYDKDPLPERLSGLALEYRILEVYSRDRGQRSAKISFNVGQGTQDIGFRSDCVVLFNALPARPLRLRVRDENDAPTFASFTLRDNLDRLYPNPSKRLAPDLFFQPQIYRGDGDAVRLPEAEYTVTCSLGPEYVAQTKKVAVGGDASEISFRMERWIDPSKYGWYSGDHHVHAAGCAHYQNPTEGVRPEDMMRQILGEKLNVGCVLTWGPCYYYQKQFFSGKDHPLSKRDELMHYDLEVSGFPSSHAGHLVLLGLTEQDYPGAKRIEDWPTWDLPILRWGKSQGAVVGFAHSGWGLAVKSSDLPNYEMPGFDGIGANEYIVDVTYPDAVDFISTMDTPDLWELNIWYQTLNVGFRTRVSGETDFPCITDSRVGQGRVYAKVSGPLSYSAWLNAVRAGRSYVSEGKSHLMDFSVNGTEVGTNSSQVRLDAPATVHATVKAAGYLDPVPNPSLQSLPYDHAPYWDIERARIGTTREVPVELVVNGKAIARKNIVADGKVNELAFDVSIERSSWVALRILGSSHTNPIFVVVGGRPIRASRQSAAWCLAAVNQCWTQKAPKISKVELADAEKAYDHAREVYKKLIEESR